MARILGLDHALVDLIIDESKLDPKRLKEFTKIRKKLGLKKGDAINVKKDYLEQLSKFRTNEKILPGGSVANIIRNLNKFGESAGLICKVGNDHHARKFKQSLNGIEDHTLEDADTANGLTFTVMEKKDRSFMSYTGAAGKLSKKDLEQKIKEGLFKDTKLFLVSGYVFEKKKNPIYETTLRAMDHCMHNGIKIMLALGGNSALERNREDILNIIQGYKINIISFNEEEAKALTQEKDYKDAAGMLNYFVDILSITRGPEGVYLKTRKWEVEIGVGKTSDPIYTNGAGDAAASALAFDYVNGQFNIQKTGRMMMNVAGKVTKSRYPFLTKKYLYSEIRKK